jgi:HemK-like putative methylase
MPRIPHALLLRAYKISSLLPFTLRATRDLPSAINELRWIREHVAECKLSSPLRAREKLLELCKRREWGEPLQYILGSQPFGELEIKCRPGVLISRQVIKSPSRDGAYADLNRPETEAYTRRVARLLNEDRLHDFLKYCTEDAQSKPLKILDLCSGSGCISLLLYSQLSTRFRNLHIHAYDISPDAINLANQNRDSNIKKGLLTEAAGQQVQFYRQDVFTLRPQRRVDEDPYDVIISNPPYISASKFLTETTRSVRNYEPSLALVPPSATSLTPELQKYQAEPEDVFYLHLMRLHSLRFQSKVLVMEIGDEEQAIRVARMARRLPRKDGKNRIEIWRDWPDLEPESEDGKILNIGKPMDIPVIGAGKIRAVVLFFEDCDGI